MFCVSMTGVGSGPWRSGPVPAVRDAVLSFLGRPRKVSILSYTMKSEVRVSCYEVIAYVNHKCSTQSRHTNAAMAARVRAWIEALSCLSKVPLMNVDSP